MPPDLRQLLGSVFGVAGGAGATSVGAPTITVTTTGVPGFIQGVSEFMQQVSVGQLYLTLPPLTTKTTDNNPGGDSPEKIVWSPS